MDIHHCRNQNNHWHIYFRMDTLNNQFIFSPCVLVPYLRYSQPLPVNRNLCSLNHQRHSFQRKTKHRLRIDLDKFRSGTYLLKSRLSNIQVSLNGIEAAYNMPCLIACITTNEELSYQVTYGQFSSNFTSPRAPQQTIPKLNLVNIIFNFELLNFSFLHKYSEDEPKS